MKRIDDAWHHETRATAIPPHELLNVTMRIKLIKYFEPFNQLLIDWMFEWGNATLTARR